MLEETNIPNIVLTSRQLLNGEKARSQLPESWQHRIHVLELDVLSRDNIVKFKNEVKTRFGGFDILVQNSGVAPEIERKDFDALKKTVNTNFFGSLYLMEEIYQLARPSARIVFVSSIFSLRGMYNLGMASDIR